MNRVVDPVKAENDRKDLLIMKLKADVFELRQRDRDYKILHEQFIQLRHHSQRQLEEKVSDPPHQTPLRPGWRPSSNSKWRISTRSNGNSPGSSMI